MLTRQNRLRRSGLRAGFTMAEIIVVILILSLLAAATVPTIQSRINSARGEALSRELSALLAGLQAFNKNVGSYPRYLAYLTAMPGSGAETYCSTGAPPFGILVTFTAGQTAKWRGPYISRFITADYTVVSNTTISNLMSYAAGPPAYLRIVLTNIDAGVATAAEQTIDGPVVSGSFTSGSFTWDGTNGSYRIAVTACP